MAHITEAAPPQTAPMTGYVLAAAGAIMFSTKAIFIKLAYGPESTIAIDAITLLALRMIFALPIYLAIGAMVWRGHARSGKPLPSRRQIASAAAVGVIGYYGASYLDFAGLVYITAQFERLILFTYPVFVMIFGALFFRSRITFWGVAALGVAYCGIAVIFLEGATAKGEHVALGVLLVLASGAAFALYQLFAKPLVNAMGSRLFTCVAMSGASAAVLLHFLVGHNPVVLFSVSPHILGLAGMIAIFSTVLPSFMLNAAIGLVGPQAVSVIGTLSPVATIVMAIAILAEPFTGTDALGTALVIAGVGLYTWYDTRKKA
jgi:drug/metabolite transporter (DMT)-like permease